MTENNQSAGKANAWGVEDIKFPAQLVLVGIHSAYLGGPMRRYLHFNHAMFTDGAIGLRAVGVKVWSPLEADIKIDGFNPLTGEGLLRTTDGSPDIERYMARDLPKVREQDCIMLLPGWQQSDGTCRELLENMSANHPAFELIFTIEGCELRWVDRTRTDVQAALTRAAIASGINEPSPAYDELEHYDHQDLSAPPTGTTGPTDAIEIDIRQRELSIKHLDQLCRAAGLPIDEGTGPSGPYDGMGNLINQPSYDCLADVLLNGSLPQHARSRGFAGIKVPWATPGRYPDEDRKAAEKAALAPEKCGSPAADCGEVRVVDPKTGGAKGNKLCRPDLIPVGPLTEVATHYGRGALKYSPDNWRKGYAYSLSYAALQRHAMQFWAGEDDDQETGSSHMAAVVFHALALMEFRKTHPELDDRPGKEKK